MRSAGIWQDHSRQWKRIGPPLRPSGQDIDLLQRLVAEHRAATGRQSTRALLLGVTEEIALMPWPPHTRLLALDHSEAMIQNVWPGNSLVQATAQCGEWSAMPIPDQAYDVVVGDGCFAGLRYPEEYESVTRETRRVLVPDGRLALRVFVRPDSPEPVDSVFEDLWAGRIANFHTFKWRLAMALHGELASGVRLAEIWKAWSRGVPEPPLLATKLGWPMDTIATIDAYRERDICYTFPRLEEFRHALSAHFSEVACLYPDYQLGERCPTMGFRPR